MLGGRHVRKPRGRCLQRAWNSPGRRETLFISSRPESVGDAVPSGEKCAETRAGETPVNGDV